MLRYRKLTALKEGSPPFQQEGNFIICTEQEPDIYYNEQHNVKLSYKPADSPAGWVVEHPSEYFSIFIAKKVDFEGETPEGIYLDQMTEDYISVAFVQSSTKKRGGLVAILNQNQRG